MITERRSKRETWQSCNEIFLKAKIRMRRARRGWDRGSTRSPGDPAITPPDRFSLLFVTADRFRYPADKLDVGFSISTPLNSAKASVAFYASSRWVSHGSRTINKPINRSLGMTRKTLRFFGIAHK
jgi:hypothetical protein